MAFTQKEERQSIGSTYKEEKCFLKHTSRKKGNKAPTLRIDYLGAYPKYGNRTLVFLHFGILPKYHKKWYRRS
jgi:hypothetical protein